MVALSEYQLPIVDSVLTSRIVQALRQYDATAFHGVSVRSESGIVTLTGSVPNWYARSLAHQLAQRQPDVSRVVDALRVLSASRREPDQQG